MGGLGKGWGYSTNLTNLALSTALLRTSMFAWRLSPSCALRRLTHRQWDIRRQREMDVCSAVLCWTAWPSQRQRIISRLRPLHHRLASVLVYMPRAALAVSLKMSYGLLVGRHERHRALRRDAGGGVFGARTLRYPMLRETILPF